MLLLGASLKADSEWPYLGARENGVAVPCDWLLVDGSSLIFRAHYGVPASVRAPDGLQVNAIQGFLDRLGRLIVQRQPRYLVVADDWAWRPHLSAGGPDPDVSPIVSLNRFPPGWRRRFR